MKPAVRVALWITRIIVGGIFILSGLIKANDPLGFSYKLLEFYEHFENFALLSWMAAPIFANHALELASFMCILEIVLGVAAIVGAFPRITSWILLILITYFTFLTGFAIYDNITDCGCFGDAIKLTPWETFGKDIVLLVLIGFIFWFRKKIQPVFATRTAAIVVGGSALAAFTFTLMCYQHLPIIDWRAYSIDSDVCKNMIDVKPEQRRMVYVYKELATGEVVKLSEDEYMTRWEEMKDGYEFVDRLDEIIDPGIPAKIADLQIMDQDNVDLTDSIMGQPGLKLLLISKDIESASWKRIEKIKTLQRAISAYGGRFTFLTGRPDLWPDFAAKHGCQDWETYGVDAIPLKTMVRANPGLILMDGCTVIGKWHWRDVPSPKSLGLE